MADDNEAHEPAPKRPRLDDFTGVQIITSSNNSVEITTPPTTELVNAAEAPSISEPSEETLLPPSRILLGIPPSSRVQSYSIGHTVEFDVGISEYISKDLPPIHAVIKQRFTDFLVNEVDLDGEVIHIKSLEMPRSSIKKQDDEPVETEMLNDIDIPEKNLQEGTVEQAVDEDIETLEGESDKWHDRFTNALKEYLSDELISQLKQLYLEGPDPPFVCDNGWGGRLAKAEPRDMGASEEKEKLVSQGDLDSSMKDNRGNRGKSGRGRGGKGRGGGRRGDRNKPEDSRKVVSDPIESKASRTGLHKTIRELFRGKLESETDTKANAGEEGRIIIRWARKGQGRDANRGNRGNGEDNRSRGTYPPFIHFTLQKTNRDTQDALGHLSRMLHCSVRDIAVAGTKDKRGVTVQRASLKRNGKTVEDVWKLVHGGKGRIISGDEPKQRGERGVRIADLNYRKAGLELGMLKGNVFVITLRNVMVEPLEVLDNAMNSLKKKGFINYYGMQRFGTSSIPTHSIGLAILQSDWHKAVSLILRHRPGEHPDVVAARDAWLIEKDLDKALDLMPRRVVAERCILESYRKMKGDTRNAMGALSTVPRNLRLMYIHAYQSYVWNAIVSERIRMFGSESPVVGDLVYEKEGGKVHENENDEDEEMEVDDNDTPNDSRTSTKSRRAWVAHKVKSLTEEDVNNYSIFDVLMPLPGKDVAYPGGVLGERYREFLKVDGLDPDNLERKQKDYSLSGSYRKIFHLPKEFSWTVLRYTDPEVPLAQADEDKLLGFEPPVIDENGKFTALQVKLQLGTASYATMALREITKTDTSSHIQSSLTHSSGDQLFRGISRENAME